MNSKFIRKICSVLAVFFLLSVIFLTVQSEEVSANNTMPSNFDLRDVNGTNFVSAVKLQNGGTCWAHATMSAMESNLIVTGLWDQVEANGTEPNLAEYHLDWWNGFNDFNNDDRDPPNGTGLSIHYGGDYLMTAAYVSRGDGAVRDKDAQYFDDPPEKSLPQYHRYHPMDVEWYQIDDELNGIDDIKQAVIDNGAVGTCMNADPNLRDATEAHWQPPWDDREPNHAVAIVGWDDSKTTPAPNDGAWLIKNSWGVLWGNDGYFWISYYDKWAGKHPELGAVSYRNVSYLTFDHALYHDYHGWRDTWTNSTSAFNSYIIENDEQMNGVSFYTTEDQVDVRITVWDDLTNGELSNRSWMESRYYEKKGFHTILFDTPLDLVKGDDVHIELNVSGGGLAYDRTSLVPTLLDPTRSEDYHSWVISSAAPNQSFFRNGTKWSDLYYENESANFCIKGLVGHVSITSPRNDAKVGVNYTASGPVSNEIDKVTIQIDDGEMIPTLIMKGNWSAELRDLRLTPGKHKLTAVGIQDGCKDVVFTTFTEFIFDNDDPATRVLLNGTMGGDGWFVSDVDIELEAKDQTSEVVKVEYNLNNGGWLVYDKPLTLQESGIHEISYCAYDIAGNVEVVKSSEIRIDMIAPETQHHLVGDRSEDDWFVTWVTVAFSGYDTLSKISTIHYMIDDVEMVYDDENPPVVETNGFHSFSYWSVDKAGNVGKRSSVHNFSIDFESPSTELMIIGDEGNRGWYTSNVTLKMEWSDKHSGVEGTYYRFTGGSWEDYDFPIHIKSDGKFELEYYSKDLVGHSEIWKKAFIKIDQTPPKTNIMFQGGDVFNGIHLEPVNIDLISSDKNSGIDSIFFKLDERDLRAFNGVFEVNSPGSHIITFFAVDRAGNIEKVKSSTFSLDLHSPMVRLEKDIHGMIFNATTLDLVPLGYDPEGSKLIFRYQLDGSDWFALDGDGLDENGINTISGITDGDHKLVIRVTDGAGRNSFATYKFHVNSSIIVDNSETSVVEVPEKSGSNISPDILILIALISFLMIAAIIGGVYFLVIRPSKRPQNEDLLLI